MPSADLTWIPGTAAAAVGALVALDANRRAAGREKRSAIREQERLAADREERRREVERDAVLRLVTLFRKAHSNSVEPDETDSYLRRGPGDEMREVVVSKAFEDEFPLWWQSRSELSVDAELITDEKTRKAVQLCMRVMGEAGDITNLGPWGSEREIVRNVAGVGFEVLGAWLRSTPWDERTGAAVEGVERMQATLEEYLHSLFIRE